MKLIKLSINLFLAMTMVVAGLFVAAHFELIDFYRPYVVLSGSMEPTYKTGSVVFVKSKLFGYMEGDVITFTTSKKATPVTHRIIDLVMSDGQIAYQTQGDANDSPDMNLITSNMVVGSVRYSIPYVGFGIDFAQTPQGFILLVIIPATIVIYEEIKKLFSEIVLQAKKLTSKQKQTLIETIVPEVKTKPTLQFKHSFKLDYRWAVVPIVSSVFVTFALSQAFFSDSDSSTNNVLGASSSYGEAFANLYLDPNPTCELGGTIQLDDFGLVVLDQNDTNLDLEIRIFGVLANSTYDLFLHQNPSDCESNVAIGQVNTDSNGNASASFQETALGDSINYWVSLTSGGQTLASPILVPEI